MTHSKLPLGQKTSYPSRYDATVLFPIARAESRASLGGAESAFFGCDIWNAWELTWLAPSGVPVAATAEIRVPATSTNLVESKSLKLYLNSFSMTRFDSASAVEAAISSDLSESAQGDVEVQVFAIADTESNAVARLAGTCIDRTDVRCDSYDVDHDLLVADPDNLVEEALHTHLLRSLCPVTEQPDIGSLGIRYKGPRIEPDALLRYVVSFRQHNDFHEACVERMFVDILERCQCEQLSVQARFQRRGGLDINPFRSNFEETPVETRLWRQ